MHEQRKWFLETESTSREEAVKTVTAATKHLEYSMNSADKAEAGLSGLTPILKEVVFLQAIATGTLSFSNHRPDQSAALSTEARPSISKGIATLKTQMMVNIFQQ